MQGKNSPWLDQALILLANNYPTGLLIAGHDGTIRFANERAVEFLHQGQTQGLVGRRLEDLFVEEDALPLDQLLLQDQPWTKLLRVISGVQEQLILEVTLIPLRSQNDAVGVAVMLRIPGVQGQVERQYVQAEKLAALDHLVAGVAHELNNPLTVILGYTELLLNRVSDEDIRSRLSLICEKTERCRRIVDNLMRFSRRKETPKAPCSMNEVLLDTLALCEYQLSMEEISIKLDLQEGLPKVPLHRREMQSVFLSLISNAHHALLQVPAAQRKLCIRSEARGPRLRLTFSDTGSGIPEDIQHKIFDPFFTTREIGEGLGLGLSVSYGIVMEHHGRLWLESSSAEGTTFQVELPI